MFIHLLSVFKTAFGQIGAVGPHVTQLVMMASGAAPEIVRIPLLQMEALTVLGRNWKWSFAKMTHVLVSIPLYNKSLFCIRFFY